MSINKCSSPAGGTGMGGNFVETLGRGKERWGPPNFTKLQFFTFSIKRTIYSSAFEKKLLTPGRRKNIMYFLYSFYIPSPKENGDFALQPFREK